MLYPSTSYTMTSQVVILIIWPTLVSILMSAINVTAEKPRRDESYPPPEFLKRFQIIHDVCIEKTGVTVEAIEEFSDGEIHEDAALKCYMNCLFHEVNIVDDEGEMHYEKFKRILPDDLKEIGAASIDACESHIPKGATQCERAWSWHVCWKTQDPKHYFLP